MGTGNGNFIARISKVNGAADLNLLNNEMMSEFTPMPVWPNNFVVRLATNASGSQTKWRIFDASGNMVADRLTTSSRTTFNDTIQLPAGCYRLEVTDTGCDGLYWWANPSQGTGSMTVRPAVSGSNIPLKGYFSGDFGCGFTQAFRIQTTLGMQEEKPAFGLSVYPNPAQTTLHVNLKDIKNLKGATLELVNVLGQQVYFMQPQAAQITIPVQRLPAGIYLLKCQAENKFVQTQVVITR